MTEEGQAGPGTRAGARAAHGVRLALGQLLVWIGTLGTAFTIYSNTAGLFDFAEWLRRLFAHWHETLHYVMRRLLDMLPFEVTEDWVAPLTTAVFLASVAIGCRITGRAPALTRGEALFLIIAGALSALAGLGGTFFPQFLEPTLFGLPTPPVVATAQVIVIVPILLFSLIKLEAQDSPYVHLCVLTLVSYCAAATLHIAWTGNELDRTAFGVASVLAPLVLIVAHRDDVASRLWKIGMLVAGLYLISLLPLVPIGDLPMLRNETS